MSTIVDENSRLSKALDLHPAVIEYIISLNPNDFSRLRNPLMRRLMPPRITLKRVAVMAGVTVANLLTEIHRIAGKELTPEDVDVISESENEASRLRRNHGDSRRPSWADSAAPVVVDLLPSDEKLDIDPVRPISLAIKANPANTTILIKHKWEPQPLYDVWAKCGVEHFAEQQGPHEWWIYVRKNEAKCQGEQVDVGRSNPCTTNKDRTSSARIFIEKHRER
jgi:hypothetical protein